MFSFANGNRYEGEFHAGLPNGEGQFITSDGQSIAGIWSSGCIRQGARVAAVGVAKSVCGFR